MSRYNNRYAQGDQSYRDPPPSRWDADRFARERESRETQYDDYYTPSPRRVQRAAPVYEAERFYEDDRYGPRGASERRYFEEDEYYDPRASRGQMVPFRPERPMRPQAPPRPGQLLRRQSSLDTFDRPPARRYDDHDGYRQGPPPRVNIPVPQAPSPHGNRYRREQPRERDTREYDEIAIQDPEYYGDEGFREYREREWVSRRRGGSRDRSRPPSRGGTVVEDDRQTTISDRDGRETIVQKEEKKVEKPYPRKGKTRMPKRMVHTKVLFDLGYPYYEENEKTLIIEKALGPENIDEIFVKTKEYREREVSTTRLIEAPPANETTTTKTTTTTVVLPPGGSVRSPSPATEIREERTLREEEIVTKPLSEAPRSIRDWDGLTAPSTHSHRSRSRRSHSRHPAEEVRETIIDNKTVIERSPSPVRTHRSSRSRHRGSFDDTTIIEKKIVREEEIPFNDSATLDIGPLSLVRNKSRSERDIKREIADLERERRHLRHERRHERDGELVLERVVTRSPSRRERHRDRDDEVVLERIVSSSPHRHERRYERDGELIVTRRRERSPSPDAEIIVERRGDEVLEVRRERGERSRSRPPPPSANLIRNMMYTLT